MKRNVMEFFALPLAEKAALAQEPGGVEGYGQAFVVSEEQTLDWADMLFLLTQPPSYRDLHLWPSRPSTFKNCLESYSVEVQRVAGELLGAMAENLGVRDHSDLTRLAASQSVRMNYYPPCPEAHVDRMLGLSPHSDAVGVTLEVVGEEEPRYRSVSVEEYTKLVFSSKLDGKNIMDAMKIN
ncbi:hypothetical protein TRIUR3_31156 [Triticum urartu]|uniref:Uncharacterized protein n=1 Tax=Triticum urartu TaxID=4572 RepID=M7Z642_TRIUA|nr:hypothetical protein TRIUR3_31156 [Triticum urartu]